MHNDVVAPALDRDDIAETIPTPIPPVRATASMSWALDEFFAAIEEEFGVPVGDPESARNSGRSDRFRRRQHRAADGMDDDEFREHVAGVVGEIMARTLGITRYTENSRFSQDLHVQ